MRRIRGSMSMATALVAVATLALPGIASASGTTIYDNIPHPTAGNYPSQPLEAQQAAEVGDRIQFAAGPRVLREVTVLLSSWGCQTGHHYTNDCATTPGATFSHPITVNLYNVGVGNAVGTLISSKTQTLAIPYRPSASPSCTGADAGKWYDGTTCYNGFATPVTVSFVGMGVTLPNQVIVGIAYNTTHYGYAPIGESAACYSSSGGCGYDSLNVALVDPALYNSVGFNPAPSDAYFNTQTAFWYCDGGVGGTGTFRLDAGCWTGFKVAIAVTAAFPVATKDGCKKDGWMTLSRADGSNFKNQGDCVSYAQNGK